MWPSWGKFHPPDRARSTREGEGRSVRADKMSLPAAAPLHPHFQENDLSRNSRAQAQRNAARPRRLGVPHPKVSALRVPIAYCPLPTANLEPNKPYRSLQRGVE
jgi:hypothetical protein